MRAILGLALLLVSGCATPPPPPAPPVPASPPAPPAVTLDWRDLPLSAGSWSYAGGVASFSREGTALLRMRCDGAAHMIEIEQPLSSAGLPLAVRIVVTTSYGASELGAAVDPASQSVKARIAATDTLLDRIAFSRGRFSVQASGASLLVMTN